MLIKAGPAGGLESRFPGRKKTWGKQRKKVGIMRMDQEAAREKKQFEIWSFLSGRRRYTFKTNQSSK